MASSSATLESGAYQNPTGVATGAAQPPSAMLYMGRIAATVENEFMLSLLQLCGNIKSWKRPQDLSNGTRKSFAFCEFESAEGLLRAMRLISQLNIDGQQLLVKVDDAMKQYLERYVQRKTENLIKRETQTAGNEKDDEGTKPSDANDDVKPDVEDSNKEDNDVRNFGIVTDEDREADRDALEKIMKIMEERLKTRALPHHLHCQPLTVL